MNIRTLKAAVFVALLLTPSLAFAWGPLTHVYLGSEIYPLGSLLPAAVYALIRKHRHDFLYGNLMADLIIGKKFLPEDRNPHSWDMALTLLDAAGTGQEKAFSFGYLSHLAADTVAHGKLANLRGNIGHTLVEVRADSLIGKQYWIQAVRIDRKVQKRNDLFLERTIENTIFSFRTNKRIFKGMLLLSGFNQERVGKIIQRNPLSPHFTQQEIRQLHIESLGRIVDVLRNGTASAVIRENPMAA